MFDWLQKIGLTAPALAAGAPAPGGILEWLGYIVHGDQSNLANSNVADVFNSIINMVGTGVTIIVILLSPALSTRFGKKAVAVVRFRAGRPRHPGVLSARPDQRQRHDRPDDPRSPSVTPRPSR